MTEFDEARVQKLAELAHVKLTDEERASFSGQIDEILGYAERIQALDTEGVAPTSHAPSDPSLERAGALREDSPRESLDREQVLEGAPDAGAGLFKVPKVLP
jgi:aspartyl-tRNA(Asn)/glutamyl-tRNA(Gln) amidotransferase subunit C